MLVLTLTGEFCGMGATLMIFNKRNANAITWISSVSVKAYQKKMFTMAKHNGDASL